MKIHLPLKGYSRHQPSLAFGAFWIALGLLVNEWALSHALSVPQFGPLSRVLIWWFDLSAIAWGWLTLRHQHSNIIANANLFCISTLVVLVGTETALRLYPMMLGQEFANGILTKYTTSPGGIYYFDPRIRMNMMIPNYRTQMYYNGYTWIHETDRYGFRNPTTLERADIALLGDSNIYGHGVNVDKTIEHYLGKLTGLQVINMARQGDSSLQESYLLTEFINQFRPKYVFYFFNANDIRDLYVYRTDAELQSFIDTPITEIQFGSRLPIEEALRTRDEQNRASLHSGSLYGHLRMRVYLFRVLNLLEMRKREQSISARSSDDLHDVIDETSLGWRFTKHAIRYMDLVCRIHDSRLVIVPMTHSKSASYIILERLARSSSIAFIDTRAIHNSSDESFFLPGDGHYTPKGAEAMARLASEFLESKSEKCHIIEKQGGLCAF